MMKSQTIHTLVILLVTCAGIVSSLPKHSVANANGLTSVKTGRFFSGWNCTLCEVGVKIAETALHLHVPHSLISETLTKFCESFRIMDNIVCAGAVSEFKDEVLTVLDQTTFSSNDVCELVFGDICASSSKDPEINWSVILPAKRKPQYFEPKLPKSASPTLRILHLADIHVDKDYIPGAVTNCGEPLCCRRGDGKAAPGSSGAGYWGDYGHCDIPPHTLDNLFQHLAANEKFDMIYWTGDLPPHNIWNQTKSGQINLLESLTEKLLKFFPQIPIYSAIGNHESAPVDSFPPPYLQNSQSESWLYNVIAKTWSNWLPNSTMKTIKYAAFYTTQIKPGFRLISINTNFCDRENFWLLLKLTDPANELNWLINVLQSAEDNSEKVHIIGHIPPGDTDCYQTWSKNYNKIVVRYSNIIRGQFFSHTHFDHFQLFYDPSTKQPVSTAYIAPSVTTFPSLNPGYRVYTVDGFYKNSSWAVLDHETHIMNITQANIWNKPQWTLEYSARKAYHMNNLLPAAWHNLTQQLYKNDSAFNLFYRHYYKLAVPPGKCDKLCKDTILCGLQMAIYGDRSYCDGIKSPIEDMHRLARSFKAC